jgi:uncharacterized protein (TIGR02466 family)
MTVDHPDLNPSTKVIPAGPVIVKENRYFPTQVFSHELPSDMADGLNARLLETIRAERNSDRKGIQRSNFRALGGWHSHNKLHEDTRFEEVVSLVDACSDSIIDLNGYHPGYRLKIGTMWAIINPPGSSNRSHIHPSSNWSGVYYVQCPKDSGSIDFTDPRTENLINPMRHVPNRKRPNSCWTKVNFDPIAGKLLIFPSWLYHSVAPNLSTEKGDAGERVIISFNLSQVRRPNPQDDEAARPDHT